MNSRCLLIALSILSPAAAQNPYTIRRIDPLPTHFGSVATSIDDAGRVSGTSGTVTAYTWTGGAPVALPDHTGSQFSRSCGVGPNGQPLGAALSSSGWDVATIWTPGLSGITLTALPPAVGDLFSIAESMDAGGLVSGCTDDAIDYKPAAWEPDAAGNYTNATPLPMVPGDFGGIAYAVGPGSTIVGFSGSPAGTHAMRWNKVGGSWAYTTLSGFGGGASAVDINASGDIVGSAFAGGLGWRMAAWPGGALAPIDLGQLGVQNTYANAINSHGDVVGSAQGFGAPATAVARLGGLAPDNPVVALETMLPPMSPWSSLISASDINDGREIVGHGDLGGFLHSFVMTPVSLDLDLVPGTAGTLNEWIVTGATPGQIVAILIDLAGGDVPLPGCTVSLDLAGVHILTFAFADAAGEVRFPLFLPDFLSGVTLLSQAFQPSGCKISDVPAPTL